MKGFTLIEILGVLIILGVISLVTIPVVTNILRENKETLYQSQINNIKDSAKNFVAENIFDLSLENGSRLGITIGKLKDLGYLEPNVINSKTKKEFTDDTTIIIENINNNIEYTVCIDISCNLNNLIYYGV